MSDGTTDGTISALEDEIKVLREKLDRTPVDWDVELDALQRSNDALRAENNSLRIAAGHDQVAALRAEVERTYAQAIADAAKLVAEWFDPDSGRESHLTAAIRSLAK